jgi:cell wall-associated NlpC family hydrolase
MGASALTPVVGAPAEDTTRWIDVSVATLWTEPGLARTIDAAALRNPANPRRWLQNMTLAQRKWLYGHLETQALYGDEVEVIQSSGGWSKVVVKGQPTPRHPEGYPGWMPTAQLGDTPPVQAVRTATVRHRSARVFLDPALTEPAMRLSYGTRLPAVAQGDGVVELVDLDGRRVFVASNKVVLAGAGAAPRRVTGQGLVREARRFLGLQYLWGGTSGFGFDCSGFTHEVYGQFGVTIPRDAGPQSQAGTAVPRSRLRRGDLVFFANSTGVHHVGMYAGRNQMLHSPRTGQPVQLSSLSAQPWAGEYAGARRYRG